LNILFSCLHETIPAVDGKNVYRLENIEEFWEKTSETGQLVMILQEKIFY
jgi:hypothetical protein